MNIILFWVPFSASAIGRRGTFSVLCFASRGHDIVGNNALVTQAFLNLSYDARYISCSPSPILLTGNTENMQKIAASKTIRSFHVLDFPPLHTRNVSPLHSFQGMGKCSRITFLRTGATFCLHIAGTTECTFKESLIRAGS